jgi:hypothetical protein
MNPRPRPGLTAFHTDRRSQISKLSKERSFMEGTMTFVVLVSLVVIHLFKRRETTKKKYYLGAWGFLAASLVLNAVLGIFRAANTEKPPKTLLLAEIWINVVTTLLVAISILNLGLACYEGADDSNTKTELS